jgi:SAM-dependent methyltransferase
VIRVLQNWHEVGESIMALQCEGLPTHHTPQKNWDHYLLYNALADAGRDLTVVDLGCGEGYTLSFLSSLGFKNVRGIDFTLSWKLRARRALAMARARTIKPPFRLRKADITRTPIRSESCDVAVSISTIEHGVELKGFLAEARRVLKPGGLLFVTTDYWEEKLDTDEGARIYGLPWQVFCRGQIVEMIDAARALGLSLVETTEVPRCSDKTVMWQDTSYTFIALLFNKEAADRCA